MRLMPCTIINEAAYAAYAVHYGKMKQELLPSYAQLMPSNALKKCTIIQ